MVCHMTDTAWHAKADCRRPGYDPDWWHPGLAEAGEGRERPRSASLRAKLICASCPVRPQCLEEAMADVEGTYGIWGGLTREERLALADGCKVVGPDSQVAPDPDVRMGAYLFAERGKRLEHAAKYAGMKRAALRGALEENVYRVVSEGAA